MQLPISFTAEVIAGLGVGRQLGFPTLNLIIPKGFKLEDGVYAAKVKAADQEYLGALFFGTRKTLADETPTLEVHLIDTQLIKTPVEVQIEIIQKIREPQKFNSVEELKLAIKKDILEIRQLI